MHTRLHLLPVLLALHGSAVADYKDDIGYTRLLQEQGANSPDGSAVVVTQAEALGGDPESYLPNVADAQFTGKTITDISGSNPAGSSSGHATAVGLLFYGNSSSIAPGIDTVNAYNANGWLDRDYLRALPDPMPGSVSDRVANHSWIGDDPEDAIDLEIVKRVDWVIETDEFIQVVGQKNNTSTNSPLLSSTFNAIAVGVTDGVHGRSTVSLGTPYVAGRTRPDLVAPFVNTSSATPVIAAAAALLVEIGHATASLSTDPQQAWTANRAGNTIFNAERSEVVKAILMAGADRVTDNSTNPDPATPRDISDYRIDPANRSANGLDIRFGAGQLNIYNSFHILSAGEQNSAEDDIPGGGVIGSHGFDYDPSFGDAGNNATGSYSFSTGVSPVTLTAALAWNIKIANNNFPGTATLHDLDLYLYDETNDGHVLVVESTSTIDNTENLHLQLDAGRDYLLEVKPKAGQASFSWDYALAWQMTVLVDTDSDGIPDSIDMDDDNDGLADTDEATYGTNPLLADTDGDGFDDAMEITYGSDPLLGSDTPAGNYVNNGDINIDGRVDAADVLLATRIVLGQLVPTGEQRVRADMVPDNQINAGDLVRIQRLAMGL